MAGLPTSSDPAAGFADPVADAQRTFRRVMDAMARPGSVVQVEDGLVPPAPLMPATAAILLTLADLDTPLWLDPLSVGAAGYLRFHCGCPVVTSADEAVFGVYADARHLDDLERFSVGEPDYPDRSATVVIQVAGLAAGRGRRLSGPGIDGEARLAVDGLDDGFWDFQAGNRALYPLGVDIVLVSGHRLAALPRTVTVLGAEPMYVAVKGGERAIDNAHRLLAEARRGDAATPELSLDQVDQQLALAVDRVMTEGSVYDRELAALAIKQARGDLIEAIFLLRAYRTTLPRLAVTRPVDTARMSVRRRISATFKDLPGGQVLGPTFDYTHRLLDFALASDSPVEPVEARPAETGDQTPAPKVASLLAAEGLMEADGAEPADGAVGDLTRQPLAFPAGRDLRLQNLARGDEGFLLALAYSTQRGFGRSHPFAGEIRMGEVAIEIVPPELGFPVEIGEITLTECEMVNQFKGSKTEPPQFTRGYGLSFGEAERKAMAMALVDRSLRAEELGEEATAPAQDGEFVLMHSDNVEASGFLQHLKLPHYVDFQAELVMVRRMREDALAAAERGDD